MKGEKSKIYKHVYSYYANGKDIKWGYFFNVKGTRYSGHYDNEKDAAMQCDLKLISLGKQPINILKKCLK